MSIALTVLCVVGAVFAATVGMVLFGLWFYLIWYLIQTDRKAHEPEQLSGRAPVGVFGLMPYLETAEKRAEYQRTQEGLHREIQQDPLKPRQRIM